MINQILPGTFNPEIVVKLNRKLGEWLIVRPGRPRGVREYYTLDNGIRLLSSSITMVNIGNVFQTFGIKWIVDLSKTYLRIPYIQQKLSGFEKNNLFIPYYLSH